VIPCPAGIPQGGVVSLLHLTRATYDQLLHQSDTPIGAGLLLSPETKSATTTTTTV